VHITVNTSSRLPFSAYIQAIIRRTHNLADTKKTMQ